MAPAVLRTAVDSELGAGGILAVVGISLGIASGVTPNRKLPKALNP